MNKAMPLTATGSAAIAVIRIAGADVKEFLRQCFDRPVVQGRCVYGRIVDGERAIDDAIVVLEAGSADMNIHGGLWIVQEVLSLLERHGFEIIRWNPEQTWAMDGDTELDREIAASLSLAKTELALRTLLNQSSAWSAIGLHGEPARPRAETLQQMLSDKTLHHLLNPPTLAIIGLPNVGKSSLANQLFGQQRSITADLPGTTRDWVGELANIDGLIVKLIDTPGQRQGGEELETLAIAASQPIIASADLVLLVVDPTQNVEPQKTLIQNWPDAILVINKSDRADWPGAGLRTVAITGAGINDLRAEILRRFNLQNLDESRPRCWTTRQTTEIQNLLRANTALSH